MPRPISTVFFVVAFVIICSLVGLAISENYDDNSRAILYLKPIEYRNPVGNLADGSRCETFLGKCDPQFTLCVSDDIHSHTKCNLLNIQSMRYEDTNFIGSYGWGQFGNEKSIYIRSGKNISIKIKVIEHDHNHVSSSPEIIADFARIVSQVGQDETIYRFESNGKNKASMTLQAYMRCLPTFYGENCERHCSEVPGLYSCSSDGFKICTKGRTGQECDQVDYCITKPCISTGKCENGNEGPVCVCQGLFQGPRCYVDYNPCRKNPCQNNGVCKRISTSFHICECSKDFLGENCEVKITKTTEKIVEKMTSTLAIAASSSIVTQSPHTEEVVTNQINRHFVKAIQPDSNEISNDPNGQAIKSIDKGDDQIVITIGKSSLWSVVGGVALLFLLIVVVFGVYISLRRRKHEEFHLERSTERSTISLPPSYRDLMKEQEDEYEIAVDVINIEENNSKLVPNY